MLKAAPVLASDLPLETLVVPTGALDNGPAALRAAFSSMRVGRVDLDRPALRIRVGLVGDVAFTRGEGNGHINLHWNDTDRSVRALHHWLMFFSSGTATIDDGSPSLSLREVALFDGATWPDSLRLAGSTRNIAVLIPSEQVPPGLLLGTPIPSDHGCGAVLAAMARTLELQSHNAPDASLALALPAFLMLLAETFGTPPQAPRGAGPATLLGRIIDFMELHLDNPELSPRTAAKACGCSVRQLHRQFEPTGTSFAETIRRLRVERAAYLLRSTELSVGEVAGAVGFADPGYLATVFRQRYGISPRDWRRRCRSELSLA